MMGHPTGVVWPQPVNSASEAHTGVNGVKSSVGRSRPGGLRLDNKM